MDDTEHDRARHGAKVSKHLVRPIKTKTGTLFEARRLSAVEQCWFSQAVLVGRSEDKHCSASSLACTTFKLSSLQHVVCILLTSPGAYCVPGLCMHYADICV